MVSLVTVIAFWKKREAPKSPESERIIPLPNLSGPTIESPRAVSVESVNEAREKLKVLKLERQILGSAVTTIYESHSKGVISEAERDLMLERYKVDLKRLEKGIEENQRIVDLHDLEIDREELMKGYQAKLAEIDAKLKRLKSGDPVQNDVKPAHGNSESNQTNPDPASKTNPDRQAIADSEKRIEQIREEILEAMDRLEQIETEG